MLSHQIRRADAGKEAGRSNPGVAIASDIGARQCTGKIGTGERFGLLHIEKGDLIRLPVQAAPLPARLQRLFGLDQRNAERVGSLDRSNVVSVTRVSVREHISVDLIVKK